MRDLRWRDFDDALVLRAVYPPELASLSKLYVMSKKGKKKGLFVLFLRTRTRLYRKYLSDSLSFHKTWMEEAFV